LRRSGEPYELTAGDLVRQSMVTTGAITNRIDRLVERGLVERAAAADRRKVIVRLTPAGVALGGEGVGAPPPPARPPPPPRRGGRGPTGPSAPPSPPSAQPSPPSRPASRPSWCACCARPSSGWATAPMPATPRPGAQPGHPPA